MEDKIAKQLEERFLEDDLNDCFIVDIKLSPKGTKLEVFVESDSGMTFNKCRVLSRYLEEYIETNTLMPAKYTLNVSSPGVGNPLKMARQYKMNLDRTIEVTLVSDDVVEGVLDRVDEQSISITIKAKKKKEKDISQEILFSDIRKAIIKPSFK